jgi:molybdopterin synthase sulfur carrier subunit
MDVMKINLRYFASVREQIGIASETIETSSRDLNELRNELIARGTNYENALSNGKAIRVAFNQSVISGNEPLTDNAEVAFFPPVTGG